MASRCSAESLFERRRMHVGEAASQNRRMLRMRSAPYWAARKASITSAGILPRLATS